MLRYNFLFFLFCLVALGAPARTPLKTGVTDPALHTLRIDAQEEENLPLLELGGNRTLRFSFDELSDDVARISYRVVHCDADWRPSRISEMEYLDGFNGNPVTDAFPSFNTFVSYYHYSVEIPNEEVSLKLSGNYALQFYRDENPEEVIATACFSLYEQGVRIRGDYSANTDIDFNKEHHQLAFALNWERIAVANPALELKVKVSQNNRRDNEVALKAPSRIGAREAVYEHNRDLILEAANNYRRFEIVSNKYRGLGVENIRYFAPLYHVALTPDEPRAEGNYYYDRDQNGRFVVRQSEAEDNDTEADYYMVHFTLNHDDPLIGGAIHLNGDFTHGNFDETSRMTYNFDTKRYERSLLLKQGHYNYQYLFVPHNASRGTTSLIEGNYFETKNEYLIKVYYRPTGARYDRLVGVSLIK